MLPLLPLFHPSSTQQSQTNQYIHASVNYSQTIQPLTINTHIDNNYPIQLQLRFNVIDCYDDIGLVTGWYQYDKYKVRIPLLGIYNYQFITLYRFDAVQHQRLLTQLKDHPSQLTTLENNSSFIEKFEFINRWQQPNGVWLPFSGKWTNGTKTLSVNPFNMDSITDQAQNHYDLVITSPHHATVTIDVLTQLGLASEYRITNGNIACPELSLTVANIVKKKQKVGTLKLIMMLGFVAAQAVILVTMIYSSMITLLLSISNLFYYINAV